MGGLMGDQTVTQIEYLVRALKAPRIREAASRLADQARADGWCPRTTSHVARGTG